MSNSEEIDFDQHGSRTDDGGVEFHVRHSGGRHALKICYSSAFPRPCRVRINTGGTTAATSLWETVACASSSERPTWFQEGSFDLGRDGTAAVSFQAVSGGAWPSIRSFRFVPEPDESLAAVGRRSGNLSSTCWQPGALKSCSSAVTFTFEVGLSSDLMARQSDEVEYISLFLQGKAVKFIFGEAHDCMTIDGDPIGDQMAGENFPYVTFVDDKDLISAVTIGLSGWTDADGVTGFAAFTGLTLETMGGSARSQKHPLVGANLMAPSWSYDREKLGLNLWLTSLVAPVNKTVARYGFTLSSDNDIKFNADEFARFWSWLAQTKARMEQISDDSVTEKLQPLYNFLLSSFSGKPANPNSPEGFLYGTRRHVSITYDVFSIYIYRLPNGEDFQSTLFVKGKQYNMERSRMEDLVLSRTEILAFAISSALKDTDLLFQMGLVHPQSRRESKSVQEVEILPLHTHNGVFRSNSFDNTILARRVVNILAAAGLRRVTVGTILEDKDGWDIYDVGAGAASMFGQSKFDFSFGLAALVCGLIQVVLPAILIWRGATVDREQLTVDVYVARLFFGMYAVFYENKTRERDTGDVVTGWLCFLPEFNTKRLLLGILANKISKLVINGAIIFLILQAYTVADVTLNALALYFVFDVDDELVDDRAMEDIRRFQNHEYFVMKSKTSLEYSSKDFHDKNLPRITFPSRAIARRVTPSS